MIVLLSRRPREGAFLLGAPLHIAGHPPRSRFTRPRPLNNVFDEGGGLKPDFTGRRILL